MLNLKTLILIRHAMFFNQKYTPTDHIAGSRGFKHKENPLPPYKIEEIIECGEVKIVKLERNRYRLCFFLMGDIHFTSLSYPLPNNMMVDVI